MDLKLKALPKLLSDIYDRDQIIQIQTLIDFFSYAEASFRTFEEYFDKWVKLEPKNPNTLIPKQFIAAALSMYANARICLKITENVNKKMRGKTFNKVRGRYRQWALSIINLRNDTQHPINTNYFYTLPYHGTHEFKIVMLDQKSLKGVVSHQIEPKNDIQKLHEYLESLAKEYSTHWAINNFQLE